MNSNSTRRITADFEYDERRFESEANSDSSIPNLIPNLGEFIPSPIKIAEGGKTLITDAGEALAELFGDIMAKPEANKPQIGGQTELRFNQKEQQQVQENQRIINQQKITTMEQAQTRTEESQKRARAQQIEQVNKAIGIKNTSYEGTVNENGELRIDVQTYFEQANSEMSEEQIKEKRQSQVAKGAGQGQGAMGENELLKGGENFGHFTKATG